MLKVGKENTNPASSTSDNIVGDLLDSASSGMFAHILTQLLFGKNVSMKSMLNMNTIKDGLKLGAGIALWRRAGRPIMDNALERVGMGDTMPKL